MAKEKTTGQHEVPDLYDINGSANFYNKCDYGLSVYRNFLNGNTELHVLKVKFIHLGTGGTATLKRNWKNGRYEDDMIAENGYDNRNYLLAPEEQ